MNEQARDAMQRPDLACQTWRALGEYNPGPGYYFVMKPEWQTPICLYNNVWAGQWEDFFSDERLDQEPNDTWTRAKDD